MTGDNVPICAITRSAGDPCTRPAMYGDDVCRIHRWLLDRVVDQLIEQAVGS